MVLASSNFEDLGRRAWLQRHRGRQPAHIAGPGVVVVAHTCGHFLVVMKLLREVADEEVVGGVETLACPDERDPLA